MSHNHRLRHRNKVLASAIAAVLAIGAAADASAAQSDYSLAPGNPWTQSGSLLGYLDGIDNHQYLVSNVTADVTGGNILVAGSISGAPITNSGNSIFAATKDASTGLAGANGAANAVDLHALGSGGGNEGLGILSGQLSSGAAVSSRVEDGNIVTDLAGYNAGTVTQNDNSIAAATAVNSASNRATGDLPESFEGTTPGSVTYRFGNLTNTSTTLASTAGVSIGNAQTTINAGAGAQSHARVDGSTISVGDALPGVTPLAVGVTVGDNAIAASYAGNQSDNRFAATSGTGFTGSVSVANAQANINTQTFSAGDAASVTDSGIGAFLGGALDGALSVSGNGLSAAAQGNASTNAIGFAQGVDVQGTGSASAHMTAQANTRVTLDGDLVVANAQRNQNTSFGSRVGDGSAIAATVLHLDAGSTVAMNGNGIDASAGGNRSANQLSADSAVFAANSVVANQQVNQATGISSEVAGGMIVSAVLGDTADGFAGLTDVSRGNVTVGGSHIGADAGGNQANTLVDLRGTNFSVWDTVDNMSASSGSTGLVTTGTTGISVGNEQSNLGGGSISARVGTGTDAFGTHGGWIGAYYNGGIDGANATVNDDVVSASAGGNDAVTAAWLGGTNGHVNAQMSSFQNNDSGIQAGVESALVGIYLGGGSATGSALTVGGGQLAADAHANRASNSIATDFANEGMGITAKNLWNTASNVIDLTAGTNTNRAGLAIASNQKNTGGVAAEATDGFVGVNVGEHPWPGVPGGDPLRGNVTGGTVGVSGNGVSASAVANSVDNGLDVGSGNLAQDSGYADQVAALGSLQQTAGAVTASASASGADVRDLEQVGAFIHGNATGTSAVVSDNGISAFAGGNVAGNTLTFAGTSYAPTATPGAQLQGSVGYLSMDNLTVSAGFALQSVQVSDGVDNATVQNGNVGLSLTDGAPDDRHAVTGSTLTVAGNTVSADARSNYASNALGLGVSYAADGTASADPLSTLSTTAALQSAQQSSGVVIGTANSLLGVIAGHYDIGGSAVSVTDNGVASKAVANTALNRLDVAAGQLAGDSQALGGGYSHPGEATSLDHSMLADYGLSNGQGYTGLVMAALESPDAANGTGIGLALGEGNLDGGSVTVSGNTQAALAQANSASNGLNLLGTQIDASAALSNRQEATGLALATAGNAGVPGHEGTLGFAVQVNGAIGSAAALPITVSDNALTAQAGFNDASNSLHIAADGVIAGAGGEAVASIGSSAVAGAQDALLNLQDANGAAVASIQPGLSGIEAVGMYANGTSSDIGNVDADSSFTVDGNQFAARSSLNNAINSVALDGAATIGAPAAVTSQQSATGSASAAVNSADVGIYNRDAGQPQGGAITRAAMTVADNSLSASASGNTASNAVSALPAALNAAAATPAQGAVGSGGSLAVANYAVLNAQNNAATVTAALGDSSIGVNADAGTADARGSASQIAGGSASVAGNRAMASAQGNSATSSIALASASGMPSASLVSSQVNVAATMATVDNMRIGVVAGGLPGISSAPATVTGNSIVASAAGNSAINHIGVGK